MDERIDIVGVLKNSYDNVISVVGYWKFIAFHCVSLFYFYYTVFFVRPTNRTSVIQSLFKMGPGAWP